MINIFRPVNETEVIEIIKIRFMFNIKPIDDWYNSQDTLLQEKEIQGLINREEHIAQLKDLQYKYYRKKLDVYLDTCCEIRSRFLKPMKNEEYDIEYLNKMWNWVQDENCRTRAIEDTRYMIGMIKKEINSNIKLLKAEKYRVNIFTFAIAIVSGIGGALIAVWIK